MPNGARVRLFHRSAAVPILALGLISACATVTPPQTSAIRTVLHSSEETVRTPGDLTVTQVAWNGSILTAKLERPELCQRRRLEEVSYQTIETRKASGVVATLALSAASAVAGGLALGFSGKLSDSPTSTVISPQGAARVGGVALVSAAAAGFAEGANALMKAGVSKRGAPRSVEESQPLAPAVVCGQSPVGGQLVLAFAGHVVQHQPVSASGQLTVDVEAQSGVICANETDLGVPLSITWQDGEQTRNVSTFNANDCILSQAAERKIAEAREMIASAHNVDRLSATEPILRRANQMVARLKVENPQRTALLKQIADTRSARSARALAFLKAALAELSASLGSGSPAAADQALDSLDLAAVLGQEHQTWIAVLQAFAAVSTRRLDETTASLSKLLTRQPGLRSCLENGSGCPAGLTRMEGVAALQPLVLEVLKRATQADAHPPPDSPVTIAGMQAIVPSCKTVTWDEPTVQACGKLLLHLDQAENALSATGN